MTFIQIVPIIISVLAIGFSLYTYCKHDRKINEQSKLINEFTLEELTKNKEQEKRATIQAYVIKKENGGREIKVYNKGKAIATYPFGELRSLGSFFHIIFAPKRYVESERI